MFILLFCEGVKHCEVFTNQCCDLKAQTDTKTQASSEQIGEVQAAYGV